MSSNSLVTTSDLNLPIAHMRSVFHADEVQRKLIKLQASGAEREHESLRATYERMLERGPQRFAVMTVEMDAVKSYIAMHCATGAAVA